MILSRIKSILGIDGFVSNSVSLIIAFKLKLTSHKGGLSLKLIIENCEIIFWYDSIYDIAINTGFPDSMENKNKT